MTPQLDRITDRNRVVIENVAPDIDAGRFPIKRVVGEEVVVEADAFTDGHDRIAVALRHTTDPTGTWEEVPMSHPVNDRWRAAFTVSTMTPHFYTVTGWVDHFTTWREDLRKKVAAGQNVAVDIQMGVALVRELADNAPEHRRDELERVAEMLGLTTEGSRALGVVESERLSELAWRYADRRRATTFSRILRVEVDTPRALFSSWYELFPRSCDAGDHGTFRDCEAQLPRIAEMGFDVVYLPPIHPIGRTNRKGANNTPTAREGEPGSPWAIGAAEGGHKAVNPRLGTLDDFERFVKKAADLGLAVALDIAFQCSPDHPYVREHPEWFKHRPDGTIQFAENPPKKYEDIVPFDFDCERWRELWAELASVIEFWIDKGVRIFRIDNPHTKPFPFWEWLIATVRSTHHDVFFLAEAFTRPKVMMRLAKAGFSQSYTYFTWRNTKYELTGYVNELIGSDMREYFRPNFWPNTPDILPEFLQYGGRPAFIARLALAATLSSNYGIYGPAFELCVNQALPEREEYHDSEKYEVKQWDLNAPHSLQELIGVINRVRREHPALQTTWNTRFYEVDNDMLLFYGKVSPDASSAVLVIVNLDPFHTQSGWVRMPLEELGIDPGRSYLMLDLLGGGKFVWQGERNYVQLDPHTIPVHIFKLRRRLKREFDFDYYL
jgi:starch synthase (maltosyl-transferring)